MRAAPARPARGVSPYPSSRHRASRDASRVRSVPDSGTAWATAQFAAGAASGVALVLLAWPAVARELKPVRCAACRGMSWNACEACMGRGKTGLRLPGDPPARLSYCKTCAGRGRCPCAACSGTGVENNWLYGPTANPGWGPRGQWRDPDRPPPTKR